jgi:hypothetical protein
MEGCGADDRGDYGVKESSMFISDSIFDREDYERIMHVSSRIYIYDKSNNYEQDSSSAKRVCR